MKNVLLEDDIKTIDDYIMGDGGLYRDADLHKAWNHIKDFIFAKNTVLEAKKENNN